MDRAIAQIESRDPDALLLAAGTIEQLIRTNQKQFVQLQDSFTSNIAGRLVHQLRGAFEYPPSATIAFLRLVRGCCLVHRASRHVFDNDESLQALLQLGLRSADPDIQIAAVDTIVTVLVRQVDAIRRFERINGLKAVCDVFKHSRTPTAVKLAIIQFLFFYLVPETQTGRPGRKTTQDKQEMLGKYLSNVDGLVRELEMNKPFGDTGIEW